ncbi:GNAT family N-acetyltransferase [Candidatus Lokiarchaeum ossiferum]
MPSQKFLRRLGFQMEGVLRDYECEKGNLGDLQMNSLLKREWQKK